MYRIRDDAEAARMEQRLDLLRKALAGSVYEGSPEPDAGPPSPTGEGPVGIASENYLASR